jgi:hypothetical protein
MKQYSELTINQGEFDSVVSLGSLIDPFHVDCFLKIFECVVS